MTHDFGRPWRHWHVPEDVPTDLWRPRVPAVLDGVLGRPPMSVAAPEVPRSNAAVFPRYHPEYSAEVIVVIDDHGQWR
jgi:hypothetical protein